jgi:hypothetical protein
MTKAEVEAAFGPDPGQKRPFWEKLPWHEWYWEGEGLLQVAFDGDGRVGVAQYQPPEGTASTIPRPSLFEHVRSWLGKRE